MVGDVDRWSDLGEKVVAVQELARAHGLDTVVLRDPAALTWLLGARVNVPQTLESACLDAVVDAATGRITIVTNAIEAPRLRGSELAGLDADWEVVPWWEGRDGRLPHGSGVGSDRPSGDTVSVAADLAERRRALTPHQQRLLRGVAVDSAAAATTAAQQLRPDTTGYAAAGLFARELLDRGLDPIVLLVGSTPHLEEYRHPLPTGDPLGGRAMLVACGRRHGLVASVTRLVAFSPLTAQEQDAYARLLAVEAAFLGASTVGARVGDAVATGVAAYATNGFAPQEWHRHHQGGFSGFQPREFPAHPHHDTVVPDGGVLAWNPSAAGWKVESTALVTPAGATDLVDDGVWPTLTVDGRVRPDVLVVG